MSDYEAIRSTDETDDEFITNQMFPLKTDFWFDDSEQTY